jgi:hypothetical protein
MEFSQPYLGMKPLPSFTTIIVAMPLHIVITGNKKVPLPG